MSAVEKIQAFLSAEAGRAYCDDCLSKLLKVKPRQQVQQKTSVLAHNRAYRRERSVCKFCKREKLVIRRAA